MNWLLSGEFYRMQAELEKELSGLYGRYESLDPKRKKKRIMGPGISLDTTEFYQAVQGFLLAMEGAGENIGKQIASGLQPITADFIAAQRLNPRQMLMYHFLNRLDDLLPDRVVVSAVYQWIKYVLVVPTLYRLPDRVLTKLAGGEYDN